MIFEIKIPSPGESITQVQLVKWLCEDGESVEKDQEIVEIDSDKASFPLSAPEDGILKIITPEGETIAVGTIIATVDSSAPKSDKKETVQVADEKKQEQANEPAKQAPEAVKEQSSKQTEPVKQAEPVKPSKTISPQAEKIIEEKNLNRDVISGNVKSKRVRSRDVQQFLSGQENRKITSSTGRNIERKKLSTLRIKLGERLVAVKNQTAMLTTFNEVNMRAVMNIRTSYGEAFTQKYGVNLGFMSFFTKAVSLALYDFPQVNAMIDGDEMLFPEYHDIGIAVSAPKGLVVPVIRNVNTLTIPGIEIKIREMAEKARKGQISIDDMQGGTFTITNGGVFGSLMSTPIINPPQSAILGMHKIMDRPVVNDGKIVIEPMMYLAVSYDHRVIDGKESVGFLVRVKEYIEDPLKMLTEGQDAVNILLEL